MTRQSLQPSLWIAAAAMSLWAACLPLRADEANLPRYVRAYVPVDGVEDWPRGDSVLEPISAREFEDLAVFLEPRKRVQDAQFTSAEFTAELAADDLLIGTADMTVSCRSKKSLFVPFEPCTLAVSDVQWLADGAAPRPALLGVDRRGIQRLRVDQTGHLSFVWSLRPVRDAAGNIEFSAELPPALSHRFFLTLPAEFAPDVQAGIATRLDETTKATTTPTATARWRIDLAGHSQFRMRLRDAEAWQPLSLVRQATTYEFLPQGVGVGVELRLVVPHDPLPQLSVSVDSPLQIVQAQLGESPVEFSQGPDAEGLRRVTFHFPAPIEGAERTLRLRGVAPLTTGERWRLPRVRPEGSHWLDGTATLRIRKPLALADVSVTQGRLSRVAGLADPASDPQFELQLFSAESAVNVVLQRSASKLDVAAATGIELTDTEINGRLTADVTTEGAERFVVGAVLSAGWELGEIESVPPGAISVDKMESGEADAGTLDGRQRYSIYVRRGIAPDRPLRLRINARRRTLSAGKNIEQKMFRMASFEDVGEFHNLIHLRARGSQQIETEGVEHLHSLKLNELDAGDMSRVEGGEPVLMWLDVPGQNRLRVELKQQAPHFTTRNVVEARVTKNVVQRRLRIDCSPRASVLESVVVSFSGADPPSPRWRVVNQPEVRVTVDRWAPASGDGPDHPIGAASWKLSFSQPLSQDFQLASDQTLPLGDSFFVDVLAVRGAEQQSGRVTIYCDDDAALAVDNRGLQPVPAPPPPAGRISTLCGAFGYEPLDDVAASRGIVLSVQREEGSTATAVRKAFAWSGTVESLVGTDGVSTHRATFCIENSGSRRLAVRVPGGGTPAILVDGDEAAMVAEPDGGRWFVDLPAGHRFCSLQVDYESDFAPSRWAVVRRIPQPRPELGIPVLAWRGIVHTPPGYLGVDSLDTPLDGRVLSWRQRLFGPLGRGPRGAVFDPFDRRTWNLVEPEKASGREAAGRNTPASLRAGGDANAADPWGAPEPLVDLATGERGWNTFLHDFGGAAGDHLLLVHLTALETLKWTIFLAVFAGVSWRPPRRFAVRVLVLAALAVLALFAPTLVAGVVTAGLLGFAAALLTGRTWRAVSSLRAGGAAASADAAARAMPQSKVAAISEALAVLAVLLICWPATSTGQPPVQPPATQSPIHRVFIPYSDDPANPVGDTYYISSEFDRALQRVRALQDEQQPASLIRSARYEGEMVWEPGQTRLAVNRLTAVFELEVSASSVVVRIPLDRARAGVPEGGVTLDGSVVQPVWNADGSEFSLPIAEAGAYQLTIALRPNTEFFGAVHRVEIDIPALCTSKLVLNLPSDAEAVEVRNAKGRVVRDSTQHQLVADLGATHQLTLTWPGGGAAERVSRPVDVRQLAWLKIRPAAVTLDARLRLKADRVRTITLATDPRLRLISQSFDAFDKDKDQSTRIARVTALKGNPQRIELEFDKTVYGEHQIDLSFFVADTLGVGQVVFPRLDVVDVRSLRQFVAVSVDPGLQTDTAAFTPGETLKPVSIDELGGPWDLPGLSAALIYEQTRRGAEFSLPTTWQKPTTQGTEQLALRRENEAIHVAYQAELETRGGYLFQHRATVPSDFVADRVTIVADGDSRPLEAFQHDDGQLTVFLAAPLTGRHVLKIDGRRPQNDDAEPATEIKLADCEITASTVLPEKLEVDAVQVTKLYRAGDQWRATVDLHVEVTSGQLDEFRIVVPPQWRGPFEISPAELAAAVTLPGAEQDDIVVRPPQSPLRLRIDAPLALAADDRVRPPDVTVQGIGRCDRYCVLPQQVDGQPVQWDAFGLRTQPLPSELADVGGDPGSQRTFFVSGSLDKVELTSQERRRREPRVLLSEVYVDWHQDGRYAGFAVFDVEPAGAQSVRLALPAGECKLVAARVAGMTAAADWRDAGQWELPLSSAELLQKIQVVYEGRWTRRGGGRRQFRSPVLRFSDKDISVARTSWTVTAPAAAGRPAAASPSVREVTLLERSPQAGAMTRVASDGPRPWLEIDYQPRGRGDDWQRIVVAITIVAGAVTLLFAERRAARLKSAFWLPSLACFLAGVLGWLLLWPGFLGLALIGVALVMALRLGWTG